MKQKKQKGRRKKFQLKHLKLRKINYKILKFRKSCQYLVT